MDNFRRFEAHRLLFFLAAALPLAVRPGRAFSTSSRSLAGGKREGVLSSLGAFVGGLFHVFVQFALLGSISVSLNTVADVVVVGMALPFERKLKNSMRFRRRQRTATGIGMIGLGAYLALADSR